MRDDREFDQRCGCTGTNSLTSNGSWWRGSSLRDVARGRFEATATSSTPSCGGSRLVRLGATSLSGTAVGSPCTTASTAGRSAESGSACSRRSSSTSMMKVASSMARSSGRTKTPRAEKGGPMQCSGPFSRRFFLQDPRDHDDRGQTASHHPHARPAARLDGSGAPDRSRDRQGSGCRRRVRLRCDRRRGPPERHEACHRDEPHPEVQSTSQVSPPVSPPRKRRVLLP